MALLMAIPPKDSHSHPPDYPVVLTVAGRRCLVVGAGPVAARKVRGLLRAGARVTVVAPRWSESMQGLVREWDEDASVAEAGTGTVELDRRPYRPGEAADYALVVTATGTAAVDTQVVSDATAAGVLVNSADGDTPGTVTLPAVHRQGAVTIGVSTGGASPALARWLRNRIADDLPAELATVALLLEEFRDRRLAGSPAGSVDWVALIEDELIPLVAAGRVEEARARLVGPGRPFGPAPSS
jgi:siroheme synthase-like protein